MIAAPATRAAFGQQLPPPAGYSVAYFEALIEQLTGRLDVMSREGDPRAVFQLTYLTFSGEVLKALKAGRFHDRAWATDMCCRFVEVYLEQLALWDRRDPGQCRPWRVAFESMEDGRVNVLQAMLLGMNAHINYDLAFVTLGACRARGNLTGDDVAERALSGSRGGVPEVRYRDFLVINQVGWESIPRIQDAVLGRFNRLLDVGNRLTMHATRFLGQRILLEARDASWCQTSLLIHAREGDERRQVARIIDTYAASVADVIGAMSHRPEQVLEHVGSWLRRWERLEPDVQAGLVEMSKRNPVVAELALHQLAFAGAEPAAVLETLVRSGDVRLAAVFATLALHHGPLRRRQRLRRYLARCSPTASAATESMLASGVAPADLPERAVAHVRERWSAGLVDLRAASRSSFVSADSELADAVAAGVGVLERRLARLGAKLDRTTSDDVFISDVAALLAQDPDPWIRLCARHASLVRRSARQAQDVGDDVASMIERVLFLKETQLFREVDPSVLLHVAEKLEARALAPGAVLVKNGEQGCGIHLVRSGEIEVTQQRPSGKVRIAVLGARDSVGELSALNDTPATADCTALTPVQSWFVPKAVLSNLLHQHPRLAIGMIRMLSQRLVATTLLVPGTAPDVAKAAAAS